MFGCTQRQIVPPRVRYRTEQAMDEADNCPAVQTRRSKMSVGMILLIVLVLVLVGVIPSWGHSRSWGYGPSGGVGLVLLIVLILLLMGRI